MAQKRPASNPPPGPGQPSSRLRTPKTTAAKGASGAPGSSSVAGSSVGSSKEVTAPAAGVRGSGSGVGSSAKRLPSTSGSGLKRGGKPVPASGSATGKLSGGSKKAQVGAGSPGAAQPIPIESDTSVDLDEDDEDEDGIKWEDVDLGPQGVPAIAYSFIFPSHS